MTPAARGVRRGLLATLLLVPLLLLGGIASARWSTTGSGTGSVVAGSAPAVTVAPGTPTVGLYPGGSADVVVVVSNPGAAPVRVGSLVLDVTAAGGGFSVDAAHSACGLATLSLAGQSDHGSGWTVPAQVGPVAGSLTVTLTRALTMSPDAADACQGAEFAVALTVGPEVGL